MDTFSVNDVARMFGVSDQTIKNWESAKWIPMASRRGMQKKRFWSKSQLEQIKQFATTNGYIIVH